MPGLGCGKFVVISQEFLNNLLLLLCFYWETFWCTVLADEVLQEEQTLCSGLCRECRPQVEGESLIGAFLGRKLNIVCCANVRAC